jgi:hypothetical protein
MDFLLYEVSAQQGDAHYVEADDLDQAIDDLVGAWSIERRQEWVIDRTTPAAAPKLPERAEDLDIALDLW